MTVSLVSIFLIHCSCFSFHWKWSVPKSRNGCEMSLKLGINFEQYVAISRKLRIPLTDVGGFAVLIASTLVGSGEIPLLENTNPKKVIELLLNSHFSWFKVRLASENFWQTACRALSWSACVFPNTTTSLLMFNAPGISRINSFVVFWNISLAELVPKFNLAYLRSPLCVANVVM